MVESSASMKRALFRAGIAFAATLLVLSIAAVIWFFLFLNQVSNAIGLGNDGGHEDVAVALEKNAPAEPYYLLLIGSDSREGVKGSDAKWAGKKKDGSDGLADVIILARVDEQADQVTLLSVPRDTPWKSKDGTWGKLNEVYMDKGPAGLIAAVKKITGVPIAHYVEVHMSGFMELVDMVGGIDVEVPHEIDYHEALTNDEIHIDAGLQHLNGAEAETFARERTSYGNKSPDMKRQSNVRVVVEAIYDKLRALPAWELPNAVAACAKNVTTDLSVFDLLTMMNALGKPEILSGTGPYKGDVNPNAGGQWLCFENKRGWARVMSVVSNGGDPSTVSYKHDRTHVAGKKVQVESE